MAFAPSLSTLAPEILQIIIKNTHASGHWPLAQTCKYIYLHSQPVLTLHRKEHEKYKITSDLDPSTVANLLWSVFSHGEASIAAWHVREFEVWQESDSGLHWKVDADTGKVAPVRDVMPWSLPDYDINYLCTKLLKLPRFYGEHRNLNEEVAESLRRQWGDWVKAILLAYLPRIKALRYAQVEDYSEPPSLTHLCGLIYWCESNGSWLPGLKSLEKIAVSVRLDRVDAAVEPDHFVKRRADEFCALLCLPNLSEVYFSHLNGNLNIERRSRYHSPEEIQPPPLHQTSPVRTIILDSLEYTMSDKLLEFLAKIPRGVQNLAICFGRSNDSEDRAYLLATELSKHQQLSLQRLCFYTEDEHGMRPSQLFSLGAGQMRAFKDLRAVNLNWEATQLELDPTRARPRSELQEMLLEVFQSDLPSKMEIIDIQEFDFDLIFEKGETDDRDFSHIDDSVEAMIRSGRYKNLKVINLKNIQASASFKVGAMVSFPKSMKAAEELGIYLHLEGSTPPPGFSHSGEFVPFPRRDCMVTGGFAAEDRERLRRPARSRSPSPF